MKNKAKLMKNNDSSDINSKVRYNMNIAEVDHSMPVSTHALWGMPAVRGGGGTAPFSAIWGTCASWTPTQQAPKPLPPVVRST